LPCALSYHQLCSQPLPVLSSPYSHKLSRLAPSFRRQAVTAIRVVSPRVAGHFQAAVNANANKAIITVSDSESANNGFGITANATSNPLTVFVRNSTISNNSNTGLVASGIAARIVITRSTITGNALDWSTAVFGSETSYDDNNFDSNTMANGGSQSTATYR